MCACVRVCVCVCVCLFVKAKTLCGDRRRAACMKGVFIKAPTHSREKHTLSDDTCEVSM